MKIALLVTGLLLAPNAVAEETEPSLAVAPKLIELVPANVPPDTIFPAPEVVVVLEIDVDEGGRVQDVRVQSGAGDPFDSAAVLAARAFRFEPARLTDGTPVPVAITFRMRLSAPPPPAPPPPPVQFRGRLLERGTRKPLIGVEVEAREAERVLTRAVTDAEGRFGLSVASVRFRLTAQSAGHTPMDLLVEAEPGEAREENLYLESLTEGFETVVRARPIVREVTRQVLPRDLVERLPGTQGDTLKVVQNLPGVARTAFGGGALVLRGASPGDSRVFLEGQEIPVLYHFAGLRSTFHPAFLEAIEFIPGNFGPEYGRAQGGVVNVRVRDPAADLFRGQVDLNFYDAGFALEGPIAPGLSIGGAFHRSYIDTILGAVLPEDAPLSFDTAPRYYDYQLLLTWNLSADQKLRVIGYGSRDAVELLFAKPQSDPAIRGAAQAEIMFHALLVEHTAKLTPWLRQETSLQGGYQKIRTAVGPALDFELEVGRFAGRTTWSLELLAWLSLRSGLDIRVDAVNLKANSPLRPLEGENPPPLSSGQTYSTRQSTVLYEPAAFLELDLTPLEALNLTPSVRVDYYRAIGKWTFDPRLVARYKVLPGTVLKGGMGYFHQPPAPDQSATALGNPDLGAPRSSHSSLGVEQELFGSRLRFEATGYYKWLDRQVIRNPVFASDPSLPPYLNGGTGRILGLELLVRGEVGGFRGFLAYTFQRSYRKDGPGAPERLFSFDQPHILTAIGTVEFGSGWSAGLRFRLVSGNPSTPVVSAVYDAGKDVWVPVYGPTNSDRLDTFHQLDIRVDKVWTFDLFRLALYLDVQNVYNHGAQEGFQYNFDYSEREPLTGLPILPILGVKGEW